MFSLIGVVVVVLFVLLGLVLVLFFCTACYLMSQDSTRLLRRDYEPMPNGVCNPVHNVSDTGRQP